MLENKDTDLVAAVFGLGDRMALHRVRTSRHTVVAGVRTRSGALYFGVNCDGIHGTCAEVVAYANAVLSGDDAVETVVAALIDATTEARVVPPCGNCRQIFSDLEMGVSFIVSVDGELRKVPVADMLPIPYRHVPPGALAAR